MTIGHPSWPQKFAALEDALRWAVEGKALVVRRDAQDGGRVRESGRPWIELAMGAIRELGEDQTTHEDLGGGARIEVYTGHRSFTVEARARSRSQVVDETAWAVLDRARTRLRRSTFAVEKWLDPVDVAIVDMMEVVNLSPRTWDARQESEAVLEIMCTTTVCDRSEENSGYWIESIELDGTIEGAAPGLNFTDKVIP